MNLTIIAVVIAAILNCIVVCVVIPQAVKTSQESVEDEFIGDMSLEEFADLVAEQCDNC